MPRMLSGLHPAIPSILPARLRHARNQPGGSKFTKSETRNLEPANEGAAAAGHQAAIYHPRRAGIARQLRETSVIFLRFQFCPHRCVFLYRRALAVVAIDPGGLGHKEVRNLSKDVRFANSIIGREVPLGRDFAWKWFHLRLDGVSPAPSRQIDVQRLTK
jgi:hypothetical protein